MTEKTINDGGPAFPCDEVEYADSGEVSVVAHNYGLTKREYFAGLAIQGICANPEALMRDNSGYPVLARAAANIADALLAKLNKKGGGGE